MAKIARSEEGAGEREKRVNGPKRGDSAIRVSGYRGLYTKRRKDGMAWYYLRCQKGGSGRWINLHTTDKAVAVRRYHQESIAVGSFRPPGKIPAVKDYWEHARSIIMAGTQKPRTLSGYLGNIEMILHGFKGSGKGSCPKHLLNRRIDRFDASCCGEWFRAAFKVYGLSAVKSQWVMWRKFFALAKQEHLIVDVPDWHIPTRTAQGQERERRLQRGEDTRIRVPEAEELVQIVADVRVHSTRQWAQHSANWILFVGCTGLRASEANQLCWKDVDWGNAILHLPSRLKGNNKYDPHINLTPPALQALRKIQAEGHTRRRDDTGRWKRVRASPDQLRESDRILAVASPRKALAEACQRLGLPRLTLHGLRHFFASQCARQGWDWATLAAGLGHRDGGILAAKKYSHLVASHARKCADKWTLEPCYDALRPPRASWCSKRSSGEIFN